MDERSIIAERLRKKLNEIRSLEDKLRSAKIYVQALQDVMKALGGESPPTDGRDENVLRAGSAVSLARDAILAAKRPVHIGDLLVAIGREDTRGARASLGGALAAYVRRGEIFTRPAPNTFGLSELGHEEQSVQAVKPPPGFGKVEEPDLDDEIPF